MQITQELLKENLSYDKESGIFCRIKANTNAVKIGSVAGSMHSDGYMYICVNSKSNSAHRLAWLYVYGEFPKDEIDHINGIKTDNRICNLRPSTRKENMQNLRNANKNNSTGFLGVSFDKRANKFTAQIHINGKQKKLGTFNNPEDAHNCYLIEKTKIHPFSTITAKKVQS